MRTSHTHLGVSEGRTVHPFARGVSSDPGPPSPGPSAAGTSPLSGCREGQTVSSRERTRRGRGSEGDPGPCGETVENTGSPTGAMRTDHVFACPSLLLGRGQSRVGAVSGRPASRPYCVAGGQLVWKNKTLKYQRPRLRAARVRRGRGKLRLTVGGDRRCPGPGLPCAGERKADLAGPFTSRPLSRPCVLGTKTGSR